MTSKTVAILLAVGAALVSEVLLLWARGSAELDGFMFALVLATALPYALLGWLVRVADSRYWSVLLAVAAVALGVLWVATFRDAMLVHPDAQGGVAFIALPIAQLGVVAALWIAWAVARVARRMAQHR